MHDEAVENTRPWQGAGETLLPRKLSLEVIEGPDRRQRLVWVADPEEAELHSVGTAENNALRLSDPTVSRYHLELALRREGLWLRDLGSLNGSYCAGLRVQEVYLPLGSEIRLGASLLRVEDRGGQPANRSASLEDLVPELIGQSRGMLALKAALSRLAPTPISVLIHGETGTGKELVAQALHRHSPRASQPFVVVDCGSLPATLIASELFGHERGAFTGAERRHNGAFERAHRGTLFLDEIGELPLSLQPALLGALERRRFRRLGGQQEIEVDVRIVAATHRDLRAEANRGAFRPDLYHRLGAARLLVPPLRERAQDIELLVSYFCREATGRGDAGLLHERTLQQLRAHRWTGNVRELRNVVEYALAMGAPDLDDLELDREHAEDSGAMLSGGEADKALASYREARAQALESFERHYLERLIRETEGNASEAARRARMDRSHLLSLLRRHHLR